MEYKELKEIMKDMEKIKLDELAIEFPDGTKINMKKNVGSKASQIAIRATSASNSNSECRR